QIWLGRWARQWATDPANKFVNLTNPNELDQQWLSLFDSIEGCRDDIDTKIEGLHQTWKHSGLVTKSWWRLRVPYLLKGVGYEVSERARKSGTPSARQMLANWSRISYIVNAQGDPDWSIVGKTWIGPVTAPPPQIGPVTAPPPQAESSNTSGGGPPDAARPIGKWWRRLMGEWIEIGHWKYLSASGGGVSEGPLAALFYGRIARKQGDRSLR
ncbi:MAG: hypothetical protein ACREOM_07090, partial [Candidatus Dormibacteraceae bacterium]